MGKLGISKVSHGITNLIPEAERERERRGTGTRERSQVCFSRKGLCRLHSGLVVRPGREAGKSEIQGRQIMAKEMAARLRVTHRAEF